MEKFTYDEPDRPTLEEAFSILEQLLGNAVWLEDGQGNPIDAQTEEGASKTIAHWGLSIIALSVIAEALGIEYNPFA